MPGTVDIDDTVRIQWWSDPKDAVFSATTLILHQGADKIDTGGGPDQRTGMGLDGECRLSTGDGYTVQLVAMHVNQTLTATTNAFSVDVDATEASMWLVVLLLALAVAFCGWWCRRHRRLRRPAVPVAQLYETGNEADACTTTSYAVAHGDKTTL